MKILSSGEYYHPPYLQKIFKSDARCGQPTEKTSSMGGRLVSAPRNQTRARSIGSDRAAR
jgi:hypothetical protein